MMNQRVCPSCGAALTPGVQTCEYCGSHWETPPDLPPASPKTNKSNLVVVLSLAVFVLAVSGGFASYWFSRAAKSPTEVNVNVNVGRDPAPGHTPDYDLARFQQQAYDASARSAGMNAKIAERIFYSMEGLGRYTDDLGKLLQLDRSLDDDAGVTFVFGSCSEDGFTFTTKHAKGKQEFVFHD